MTENNMEEKSSDFCPNYVQEFGLGISLISDIYITILYSIVINLFVLHLYLPYQVSHLAATYVTDDLRNGTIYQIKIRRFVATLLRYNQKNRYCGNTKPTFINLLRSPGIDSPLGYIGWRSFHCRFPIRTFTHA